MTLSRGPIIPLICALVILIVPFTGLLPDYWITLFNYIGISSLVAIGLVLLTGVGGMTSFGQAAFVAAILGGLVSYPMTVLAALGVGFAEALFSFWASNFKEVLVFTLIIPVLAWRSLYAPHVEETE